MKNVILLLDTGASITTIHEAALAEVGIDLSRPQEHRRIETMGGPVVEGIVAVPRLRVMGQEQAQLEVVFTRRPFPYRVDGVLGLNFLLPYRLCVDFPNDWIELVIP
ncbi:MAG: retropepsin-like aspartic protease [Chloroflexota bacterium]|nr:retropepsin-like aspartic protease [Chloroflexota bacterium]